MLKNRLAVVFSIGIALGCSRAPESVSISEAIFQSQTESVQVSRMSAGTSANLSFSDKTSAIPQRTLYVGSGSNVATEALAIARQNQERAYREALRNLTKSMLTQASKKNHAAYEKLQVDYTVKFKNLYSELRSIFDEHADVVGPKWVRLATVAGFPNKLEPARKSPDPLNIVEVSYAKEAEILKVAIKKSDADYRRAVSEKIENLRQEFRKENSILMAQSILEEDAAKTEAEKKAREISIGALKDLETSMISEIERLDEVPARIVQISHSSQIESVPDSNQTESWSSKDRKRDRIDLFVKVNGYRLAKQAPGVRDVTQEFLKWDKSWAGHSPN